MDLLFNINATEAYELHDVLGFMDADFSMAQVFPYLKKSSKELVKWIGELNYGKAVKAFKDSESNDEFLMMCRYAVALGAARELVPLLDVSYTTQGRAFRADENLKPVFEHQRDYSDDAMERNYYAALNEIITYISETKGFEMSPKIQKVKELFVSSLDIFQDYVNIDDSHLLFLKLVPSLRLAEQQVIKARTGAKFTEYKESDKTPINALIKNICVYFAMADGIKKYSVQLFPRGVLKAVSSASKQKQASQYDVEATALYYKDEMNILLQNLETAVAKDKQVIIDRPRINFTKNDGFVSL